RDNCEWLGSYVEVVEEPWRGSQFLFELNEHALVFQDIRNLAVRIENVPELTRARGADLQAGRVAARARPLDTEVAFFHDPLTTWAIAEVGHVRVDLLFRDGRFGEIEVPSPEWAGSCAVSTTDAPVVIDDRDAVAFLPGGMDGTDFDAG